MLNGRFSLGLGRSGWKVNEKVVGLGMAGLSMKCEWKG